MLEGLDWSAFDDRAVVAGGTVVGVVGEGGDVVSKAWGTVEPGGAEVTADTVLYAASVAKQFTAACIAEIVVTGRLSLSSLVREIVPGLPQGLDGIDIGHLLSHTSGLPDSAVLDEKVGFAVDRPMSNGDRLRALDGVQLEASPGTKHRYSNHGYVLLAEAVREVTGMPFGAFAREALFNRAGMGSSGFLDVDHPTPAPGWSNGQPVEVRFTGVGDGGLVTTLSDLVAWNRWLPSSHIGQLVLGDRPTLPDGSLAHDAWGVSIRPHHGLRIESHGGAMTGYLIAFVRFPAQNCAFIAMTNADDLGPNDFNHRLQALASAVLAGHLDRSQPDWTETHGQAVRT